MKGASLIALHERRANAMNARAAHYSDDAFKQYMAQLAPKRGED